jgi:hypothetical protein
VVEAKSTIQYSYIGFQISREVARGFKAYCAAIMRRPEHESYAAMLAWLDLPVEVKQQTAIESAARKYRPCATSIPVNRDFLRFFKQACEVLGYPVKAGIGGALVNWIRMD